MKYAILYFLIWALWLMAGVYIAAFVDGGGGGVMLFFSLLGADGTRGAVEEAMKSEERIRTKAFKANRLPLDKD